MILTLNSNFKSNTMYPFLINIQFYWIFSILGIEKCRSNGGSIRKINCKPKKKKKTKDYSDKIDKSENNEMTCCCNVKCDPIEKPARQLLEEYGNVWWPDFTNSNISKFRIF